MKKKVLRSLDLRGNMWQETGENNIVRSFIIFPLLRTHLECSNQDGTNICRVRGSVYLHDFQCYSDKSVQFCSSYLSTFFLSWFRMFVLFSRH